MSEAEYRKGWNDAMSALDSDTRKYRKIGWDNAIEEAAALTRHSIATVEDRIDAKSALKALELGIRKLSKSDA